MKECDKLVMCMYSTCMNNKAWAGSIRKGTPSNKRSILISEPGDVLMPPTKKHFGKAGNKIFMTMYGLCLSLSSSASPLASVGP